jgi:hypothetical protein
MISLFNKSLSPRGPGSSINYLDAVFFQELQQYTFKLSSIVTLYNLRMTEQAYPFSEPFSYFLSCFAFQREQ